MIIINSGWIYFSPRGEDPWPAVGRELRGLGWQTAFEEEYEQPCGGAKLRGKTWEDPRRKFNGRKN